MEKIVLYHGSTKIVEHPKFSEGKTYNDYGQGFYCTKEIELAKEWACSDNTQGYVNQYSIDLSDLKVLDLSDEKYTILNWIAILLENRIVNLTTPLQKQAREYLTKNFLPDYKDSDIIVGYRADDAYFSFARAFVSNEISLAQLGLAMRLGRLGLQYCIKSKTAFDRLKFVDFITVDNSIYYEKKKVRDDTARSEYFKQLENSDLNDIFIRDILRENMKNDDKRLQI